MAHDLNTRTTSTTVVFHHPFTLCGLDGVQPPGAYRIDTYERLLDTVSSTAYLRISTSIELQSQQPGVTRSATIDPAELDAALARDAAGLPGRQSTDGAAPETITDAVDPAAPSSSGIRHVWRRLFRNRRAAS